MKTSEAFKIIFEQLVKTVGSNKAPAAFATTISGIVYELNEANKFTPAAFEEAIINEAELCMKCSTQDVA